MRNNYNLTFGHPRKGETSDMRFYFIKVRARGCNSPDERHDMGVSRLERYPTKRRKKMQVGLLLHLYLFIKLFFLKNNLSVFGTNLFTLYLSIYLEDNL